MLDNCKFKNQLKYFTLNLKNVPLEQWMSPAPVHNGSMCLVYQGMKLLRVADVIVYMKWHRHSSLNIVVYSSNPVRYIHHQGHHFYNSVQRKKRSYVFFLFSSLILMYCVS